MTQLRCPHCGHDAPADQWPHVGCGHWGTARVDIVVCSNCERHMSASEVEEVSEPRASTERND